MDKLGDIVMLRALGQLLSCGISVAKLKVALELMLALQWAQLKHDENYHKEIVLLPVGDRMKHFALHMAKYSGYLADAIETHDDQRLERTLVDAFIISVASANTLGFDIGKTVGGEQLGKIDSLQSLGHRLVEEPKSTSESGRS